MEAGIDNTLAQLQLRVEALELDRAREIHGVELLHAQHDVLLGRVIAAEKREDLANDGLDAAAIAHDRRVNRGGAHMKVVTSKVVVTEMGAASFFRMCLTLGQRYIEQAITALELQEQAAPSDTAAEHQYCSQTMNRLLPADATEWLKHERAKVRAEFWGLISAARNVVDANTRERGRTSDVTPLDATMASLRNSLKQLPLMAAHPELNVLVALWFERAELSGAVSPRVTSAEAAFRTCASELFELLGGGRK